MAARTATVQNICAQPGTPLKAITRGQVAVKLNTISFTVDGTTEKARHRYTDVDPVTGYWSMVLELNDDLDPPGTYWKITEPTGATWTIQLVAAHAGQTVNLRDVLVDDPANPNRLVAGVPLPGGAVPSGYVWTTNGAGGGSYLPESGGGGTETVNGVSPDGGGNIAITTDNVPDGTTTKAFLATERTKLAAISGANTGDQDLSALAPKASPALTGTPTAPTAAPGTNSTQLATTAYVDAATAVETSRATTAEGLKAPLASPHLTGTPLVNGIPIGGNGSAVFGLDPAFSDGTLNQPWKPAAPLTGNLATGTVTLPYSFTSTATGQTNRAARVPLQGGTVELPAAVRILFTASIPATSANFGNASLVASFRSSGGSTLNADVTILGQNQDAKLNYIGMAELPIDRMVPGPFYLDINFVFPNNYTGTVTLTELDVRLIPNAGRMLRVGGTGAALDTATTYTSGTFVVDRPAVAQDGVTPIRIRTVFAVDGAQEYAYSSSTVFLESLYPGAQPGNDSHTGSSSNLDPNQVVTAPAPLHINNNDLVLSVQKTDLSYELRGNTHGGESGRTGTFNLDYIFEYDRAGDGTWTRCHGDGQQMYAYRARVTIKTKVVHSDSGLTLANIDRVYTFFADGPVRVDRTITTVGTNVVNRLFYFMNSIDPALAAFRGRVGLGRQVLNAVSQRDPSTGPIAVNGAHLSGVTSVNYNGTTQMVNPGWTGSRVKIGTGGTADIRRVTATSSSALTLDAATTNAHAAGESIAQLDDPTTLNAASAVGATTIQTTEIIPRNARIVIDSGTYREIRRVTAVTTASSPYTVTLETALAKAHASGARVELILPGDGIVQFGKTEWCALEEPQYGVCFGQIIDRQQIAAHGLGSTVTTLAKNTVTNYISKIYSYIVPPTPLTITAGTVITDTLWWHYYVPASQSNFHSEIAEMSLAGSVARAAVYPAT